MDKAYLPAVWEPQIREQWEKDQPYRAVVDPSKSSFTVILPPPNANGSLHAGHVMMVYQDIMCRHARAQGKSVLYLPGTDHAGFETQFVFEKYLSKQGKSRFDYDRETLYKEIEQFVMSSKDTIVSQFKSVGFSLDWSREQFTLDPAIVKVVHKTFKKLFEAGLLYRSARLVNYCCKDGTSFSDLEVENVQTAGSLYHLKYKLVKPVGDITEVVVATTRPETMLGDVAVMVHPDDTRYTSLIGQMVQLPLTGREIPIIADTYVDMAFGTGAVKVTPNHDHNDFEVGKRHGLSHPPIIGFNGKMCHTDTKYDGMKVKAAREMIITDLTASGFLLKTEAHEMVVKTCYKCGSALEPLPLDQWYVQVKPLADRAKKSIEALDIQVYPPRFKETMIQILDNYIDWNISRQIVWGIRIPAYRCAQVDSQQSSVISHKSKVKSQNAEAQSAQWFVSLETPTTCQICGACTPIQDTDTFDTWFSSGQWPFATLMAIAAQEHGADVSDLYDLVSSSTGENLDLSLRGVPLKRDDVAISSTHEHTLHSAQHSQLAASLSFFHYFYPTSVMETGYDIARAWVARMMMLGLFVTGKPPFTEIYLHGMVRDGKGQKMSKSKGNVIDPLKLTEKYGTDALRMALVYSTTAGNDTNLSEDKVLGMRNFVNKLWNMGRFLQLMSHPDPAAPAEAPPDTSPKSDLDALLEEHAKLVSSYHSNMAKHEYSQVLVDLYEFIWHRFADIYIEKLKNHAKSGNQTVQVVLTEVYLSGITMLAPFAPFVCEAIQTQFVPKKQSS
ncbi:MAG: class I tRNA ligase family protein [bacterium]